ncbi:MAG: hypothetical protein HQ567_01740 [Candidatus Nealsonbacteria bacterium]|nr:hypothetical protein [Candidatus Nealsonbacteria bacterium]
MSPLEGLLSSPIVYRVGWGLVHFVWQATAIAAVLAIAWPVLRRSRPGVRHGAAWAALLMMAACLPVTAWLTPAPPSADASCPRQEPPAESRAAARTVVLSDATAFRAGAVPTGAIPDRPGHDTQAAEMIAAGTEGTSSAAPVIQGEFHGSARRRGDVVPHDDDSLRQRAAHLLQPALPWVVGFWLVGVVMLSTCHLGGWLRVRRLGCTGTSRASETLEAVLTRLARQMRIHRVPVLLESALAEVPTVIGWLRPVVLLPVSILGEMSPQQIELILAHELAHVRRRDYLLNLVQTFVETLLFYHPGVWWVSRRIRVAREECCDDLVVSATGEKLLYARTLTKLEELRHEVPAAESELSLAADGGSLIGRIRRLVGLRNDERATVRAWLGSSVAVLLLIGALVGCLAWADDPAEDQRDSATAKDVAKPQQVAGRYADRIRRVLPTGWSVKVSGKEVHVSRDEKVEWYGTINLPPTDAKDEEGRKRELKEGGFVQRSKYVLTLRFAPPVNKAARAKLRAENDATREKLRQLVKQMESIEYRKWTYFPKTPEEKKLVARHEALHKSVRKLPDFNVPDAAVELDLSIGDTSECHDTAFYGDAVGRECRQVRETVAALFAGADLPGWARAVKAVLADWEVVECDRRPGVDVGSHRGYRMVLRKGRLELLSPPRQQKAAVGIGGRPPGDFITVYTYAEFVLFPAGEELPPEVCEKIPWQDVTQEHFVKAVDLGTGRGLRWFGRMPLYWQEFLRDKLKLQGGDDRLALLTEGLFVEDKGGMTANSMMGLLGKHGDRAFPYIEAALAGHADKAPWKAIHALSYVQGDRSTALLKKLFSSDDERLSRPAAYALINRPFRESAQAEYFEMLRQQLYVQYAAAACVEFHWAEAAAPLRAVCEKPKTWGNFRAAWEARRTLEDRPVSKELKDAEQAIRDAAHSTAPAEQQAFDRAKQRLMKLPDKEAVTVTAVALSIYQTKASRDRVQRVQQAGREILRSLPADDVKNLLTTLVEGMKAHGQSEGYWRDFAELLEWLDLAKKLPSDTAAGATKSEAALGADDLPKRWTPQIYFTYGEKAGSGGRRRTVQIDGRGEVTLGNCAGPGRIVTALSQQRLDAFVARLRIIEIWELSKLASQSAAPGEGEVYISAAFDGARIAGFYPLPLAAKQRVLAALRQEMQSLIDAALAAAEKDRKAAADLPWGEAVREVHVRLRADRTTWNTAEVPILKVDLRNNGKEKWYLSSFMTTHCYAHIDGLTYLGSAGVPAGLFPNHTFTAIPVKLTGSRQVGGTFSRFPSSTNADEGRLELKPGKHVVRVSFRMTPIGAPDNAPHVEVFSNPVEVEIAILDADASEPLAPEAQSVLDRLNGACASKPWREEIDWIERPETRPENLDISGEVSAFVSDCKQRLAKLGVALKWNAEKKVYEVERNQPRTEGVQLRLRASAAVWKAGETPAFKIDVHNHGPKTWALPPSQELYEIEVDGRWYTWRTTLIDVSSPYTKPGKGLTNVPLRADGTFFQRIERTADASKFIPLEFPPGRHTIRVACSPNPEDLTKTEQIRVLSNAVTIEVAEAAPAPRDLPPKASERAEKLKANINDFRVAVGYHGPPRADVQGPGPLAGRYLTLGVSAQSGEGAISKSQARAIIDHLAQVGHLANAENVAGHDKIAYPRGPAYTLEAILPSGLHLMEDLGWGLPMLGRLDALRAVLDGDAAKAMDTLLGRMAGRRKQWESARDSADKDAVAALKKLGAAVRLDDKGEVTLVSFARSSARFTDADLVHLEGLSELKTLYLHGREITDRGLPHLKGLVELEELSLRGTGVTDAGLDHLNELAKLRRLDLRGTHVTEEGVKKLKRSLPNVIVDCDAIAWGKPADGLRCAWVPVGGPVAVGTSPQVAMRVENVGGTSVLLEGGDPVFWTLGSMGASKFQVTFGRNARVATVKDVKKLGGTLTLDMEYLKAKDPVSGRYFLKPGGQMTLRASLPWKLEKPGRVEVESRLQRHGPCHAGPPPPGPGGKPLELEIVCPPLVLEVVEQENRELLPGSQLSVDEAVRGRFFAAAVYEAVSEPSVGHEISQEDEQQRRFHADQWYNIVEVLGGNPGKEGSPDYRYPVTGRKRDHHSYAYFDAPDCRERPIRKGERVIWISYRWGYRDGGFVSVRKALQDTPENRAAVGRAIEDEQRRGPTRMTSCSCERTI